MVIWDQVQICIWPSRCHCHSLSPIPDMTYNVFGVMLNPAQSNLLTISCSSKSRLVLPSWYLLTQVVPEQFQNSSVVCVCVCYCCLIPLPKKEVMFLVRSVCLSVCPLDYSQTCERIFTKFFGGVGHGSRTKWYNFGGDPDHTSDPGVQSPKSGSSASVEVCAL